MRITVNSPHEVIAQIRPKFKRKPAFVLPSFAVCQNFLEIRSEVFSLLGFDGFTQYMLAVSKNTFKFIQEHHG